MSDQDLVVRLLLIDDKLEEAEQAISLLRNGGIAVRASRPESLQELQTALTNPDHDLILASYRATSIPFAAVAEAVAANNTDSTLIAHLDQLEEVALSDAFAKGAKNFVLRGRAEHLRMVIRREAKIRAIRRSIRRLESALRETERRCDALIESSRDPIAYVHEGMHIRANQAYLEIFGYESFEEIEGLPLLDMISSEDADTFKQLLKDISRGETPPEQLEFKARHSNGSTFDATMEFTQASYEGEPCIQTVLRPQLFDAEMARELDELRQRDQVTGLFNRQHFLDELDNAVAAAVEGSKDQAMLLMELDNYATLLNAVGVTHVDELLRRTGERIQSKLPETALVARFTDHSFAVLLKNSPHAETRVLADTLCKAFESAILEAGDHSLSTTLSIGGVQIGQKNANAQQVLGKIHANLQSAQVEGGNRHLVFDPLARDRAEEERIAQWVVHMEKSMQSDGFITYFQPIIHLLGEPEESYLVLLRLTAPNGEIVAPNIFMPIAQEHGLMVKIDRWVVQHAINALAKRQREGRETRLFVKISTDSLHDPLFPKWIENNLKQSGVTPRQLVLSLPESNVSTNLNALKELHAKLSALGCLFCIEQFGSGLNSFQLLTHISANFLSLDRNLSDDLVKNVSNQEKLKQIIRLAGEQGRKTIAEGVPDAASMIVLFNSGVDYAMGNFLGAPGKDMNFDFDQQ